LEDPQAVELARQAVCDVQNNSASGKLLLMGGSIRLAQR
jgi:hypothetical protein